METRTLLIVQNKIQGKSNYQSEVGERTFPFFRSHKMQFYLTIQQCYTYHSCKTMFGYFCRGKAAVRWWAWVLLQYFDVALFNCIYHNLCLISWQQLESLQCLWVICKCLEQRCFFCILVVCSIHLLLFFSLFAPILSSVNYVMHLFQMMNCLDYKSFWYKHQEFSSLESCHLVCAFSGC